MMECIACNQVPAWTQIGNARCTEVKRVLVLVAALVILAGGGLVYLSGSGSYTLFGGSVYALACPTTVTFGGSEWVDDLLHQISIKVAKSGEKYVVRVEVLHDSKVAVLEDGTVRSLLAAGKPTFDEVAAARLQAVKVTVYDGSHAVYKKPGITFLLSKVAEVPEYESIEAARAALGE